ncbi:MAG TPA: rRNA maturation RNase YbeY [Patescibacteria group bacterium]|nr:rRNA maturation RNase YbeY [Patescibacteria group bacterium]
MIEINNINSEEIDLQRINNLAQSFLDKHGLDNKLVSIAFISKAEMRKINRNYRDKDKNTDVLSFTEERGGNYLGEVLINYDKIKEQAKDFKNSNEKELDFILVHGLLHLLGYSDEKEKDKEEMIKLGDDFLEKYYNQIY